MFQRFECEFQARIHVPPSDDGPELWRDVQVRDISTGGVKLALAHELASGTALDFFLREGTGGRVVRLPARVAWTGPGVLGLMFAGGPSFEDG